MLAGDLQPSTWAQIVMCLLADILHKRGCSQDFRDGATPQTETCEARENVTTGSQPQHHMNNSGSSRDEPPLMLSEAFKVMLPQN